MRRARLLVAMAAVVGLLAAPASRAGAEPGDLDAKRAQAAEIEAQLAENGERISELAEAYNNAVLEIEAAEAAIADAQDAVETAEADQAALRREVAERAAALYVASAGTPAGLVQFDVREVTQVGAISAYVQAAQAEDAALVDDLTVAAELLDERIADLERTRDEAEAQRDEIEAQRAELEAASAEQEEILAGLEDDIAELVAEERARREAEDAERARAALEAARQELPDDPPAVPVPTAEPAGDEPAGREPVAEAPPVSGAAGIAVQTAYDQLGDPYVYAAAGPDAFDCSGLTQYAWAAAGVYLPHSSQMQYASLPHVTMDELQPGDLVFYGSPIHHVGIYVGGGSYIHAPQTGDVVKISSIYRDDFAGAARPG